MRTDTVILKIVRTTNNYFLTGFSKSAFTGNKIYSNLLIYLILKEWPKRFIKI